MTITKFSFTEAGKRIGRSRSSISRYVNAGELTAEIDEKGRRVIDASEMVRVFGDKFQAEPVTAKAAEGAISQKQFDEMQRQLVSQYEHRIDDLKENNAQLAKALDEAHQSTKLLESRFQETDDWKQLLETKTQQLANDTARQIEEIKRKHQEETKKWEQRARLERNKTWWDKLFEKKRKRVWESKRN